MLDAYNLGSYITLNLTDDGFAIPEIMNRGLFTDDEHISYITFVPEITWTATDAFLNKGVGYARISISIDVPDSVIDKYLNELTALKFDFESKEYVYIEPEIEYIGITEMTKADGFDETMKPVGINGVSCIVLILMPCLIHIHIFILIALAMLENMCAVLILKPIPSGFINMKM